MLKAIEVCSVVKFSISSIRLVETKRDRTVAIGSVVVTDPKLLLLASIAKLDNFSGLLVHILIAHQRS